MDRERGGGGRMSPAKIKNNIPVFTIKITCPFMFNSFRESVKTLFTERAMSNCRNTEGMSRRLPELFAAPWSLRSTPEILYLKRAGKSAYVCLLGGTA